MRKHGKKVMSLLLSLSMIAGLFLTSEPMETVAAKKVTVYEEDFEGETIASLENKGWKIAKSSDGSAYQYDIQKTSDNTFLRGRQNNSYYAKNDAYNWTDYTFETDFTIGTKPESTVENGKYYGIRFGVDSNDKGLEYRIRLNVAEDGTHSFQYDVYDRINTKQVISRTDVVGQSLAMDQPMKLKVKLDGSSFTLYLNGIELVTKSMSDTIKGSIGTFMNSNRVYTYYDNMKVTKDVDPEETEQTLMLETFSSQKKPTTWANGLPSDTANYATEALMMDTSTNSYTSYYTGDGTKPYTWSNYTYSAQLRFDSFPTSYANNSGWYCIWFGKPSTESKQIEFGINYNTGTKTWNYRVHDRRNTQTVISQTALPEDVKIVVGEPLEMTAVVCGKYLSVYINDILLKTVQTKTEIVGTVGVQVAKQGAVVYYDDLHVTQNRYDSGEANVISAIDFSSVKDGETPFTRSNGWLFDADNYVVSNGRVRMKTLDPLNPSSHRMEDGYVSADFQLETPEAKPDDGSYFGPAQIYARSTAAHSGEHYESRLRFVVRYADGVPTIGAQGVVYDGSSTATTFYVVDGLQYDTTYTFKITCIGNRILFEVFDVNKDVLGTVTYMLEQDNGLSDRSGVFGIGVHNADVVSKIPAYANNVTVHQFNPYTITDTNDLVGVTVSGTVQGDKTVTPSEFYAGETVTVNVTDTIKAGSLQYTYVDDETVTKNIFAQPADTAKGEGTGDTFVFTMPAANITLQAEAYAGVEDSMASVATSLAEEGDSIRFLNRIYLPGVFGDAFDNTTNVDSSDISYGGYTIVDCGAIVLPKDWIDAGHQLELENQYVGKVSMASTENFKLYDKTTEYLDFTIKITNVNDESRVYAVRTYVTLQKDSETTITLYGNTVEQSIAGLQAAY